MENGSMWIDVDGKPIQAHGGMILCHDDTYYWYGENKDGETKGRRVDVIGISCYSSKNLINWKYEGLVLNAQNDPNSDLHPSRVCERPKVIYNKRTGKFVMWFHADASDYSYARAGLAISDSPIKPFTYIGAYRPNGGDCRDMTVFKDVDDKAYLIHSSERNKTLYISQLSEDYTEFTGIYTKAFSDQYREAPAICFYENKYYMITSGCTGWLPNPALYAISNTVLSGWRLIDNPCSGDNYRKTFNGQSTFIFESDGTHYLMLDHWNPNNLRLSGYSILPITISNGYLEVPWAKDWLGNN